MRHKKITRSLFAVLVFALLIPLFTLVLYKPAPVQAGSCAEDPNNLLKNGTMAGQSYPPYGVVAANWKPFVISATDIHFENPDNEGYDPDGSQYIWQDFNAWDAGIFQQVKNLTPGQTYHVWFVWGQALHDMGGDNARATMLNRQLGVDVTGHKNPLSPQVQWTVPYYGGSGFNRAEWHLTFTATKRKATFFLRAQNHHLDGRNKIFFDTACLYPAGDDPTTTPWANTSTPTDTLTATPTDVPTDTPTATPTLTATPTPERVEDTDPAIQYGGEWQQLDDASASGGTYHIAHGVQDTPVTLNYTFEGTGVTLHYITAADHGKVKVFIDGVKVGTLNQYSPDLTYDVSKTFSNLAPGTHTLKLKNAGARSPLASDSFVTFDALEVMDSATGAFQFTAGRVTYTPTPTRRWVPHVIPFALADPGADPPDDPTVIWDSRLPGLNVYLDPANVPAGTLYWKLIRADYQDGFQSGGNHNIYYTVTDQQGKPVSDQTVWQSWPGDATSTQTRGDGTADIAIWSNYWPQNGPGPYNAYIGDLPSDTVRGMGLPGNNHVNFILYFQKTIKSGSITPTNTPTLTATATATTTATPTDTTGPTATPTFTPSPTNTPSPTPPTSGQVYLDDTDPALGYKGAWNQIGSALAYGGSFHTAAGAKGNAVLVRASFTGSAVAIQYVGAPNRGKAKIIIDGVKVGKIDQYRAQQTPNLSQTFGNLSPGTHQLKIKNAGARNPNSGGTYISLDVLIITTP